MDKGVVIGIIVVIVVILFGGAYLMQRNDEPDVQLPSDEQLEELFSDELGDIIDPEDFNDLTTNSMDSITPISEKITVTLKTNQGDIVLELDGTRAPKTVGNFVQLAESNFYDGVTFHRIIPNFMIQGGDPLSKDPAQRAAHGTGGPEYTFEDEINDAKIVSGTVAMANSGPNTNGSQFFIVTAQATPHLDGLHTNFGKVVSGMEVVDAIEKVETDARDNPVEPVVIEDVIVDR